MRKINCVALEMTTVCDRACPDCCANINRGEREVVHHPWSYFERAAEFLRGVDRIRRCRCRATVVSFRQSLK